MSRAVPILLGALMAVSIALGLAAVSPDCRLEPVGQTASHTVWEGHCP